MTSQEVAAAQLVVAATFPQISGTNPNGSTSVAEQLDSDQLDDTSELKGEILEMGRPDEISRKGLRRFFGLGEK